MAGQEPHLSNHTQTHSTGLNSHFTALFRQRDRTTATCTSLLSPRMKSSTSTKTPWKMPASLILQSSFFTSPQSRLNTRDQEATTQITATVFLYSVTLHLLFLTFQVIRGTVFWLCTLSKGGLWFMRITQKLQRELPLHNRVLNPKSSHFCS